MQNSEDQKAILKVNADGEVVSCAKGADASKCGWKAGDKVCGTCGAMAVMTKADDMEDDEEDTDVEDIMEDAEEEAAEEVEEEAEEKAVDIEEEEEDVEEKAVEVDVADDPADDEEEIVIPDDEEEAEEKAVVSMGDDEEEVASEMDDDEEKADMEEDDEGSSMEEMSEDDEEEMEELMRRKKMRQARLRSMGYKDAQEDDNAFLCGQERKVLPGGSQPCEGCTGGCFPVGSAPDLLTVEELALDVHGGKILDSGYSSEHDKFVVDIRRKDGRVIEAYFDGDGTEEGWHVIPEDMITMDDDMVSGDEAILVALGQVSGKALDLAVQMVDGEPAYVVEVDGEDGFSYDVFVSLEGKALYADQWEYETADASEGVEAKSESNDELTASLMEFQALMTEAELKDQGLA